MTETDKERELREKGFKKLLFPFTERRFMLQTHLGLDINDSLVTLLESITERAANFSMDCHIPKMDLSALYCLGIMIQEYSRYLGTDILTEKRVTEGLEPLESLFTSKEINQQKTDSIIEKYQSKHAPATTVVTTTVDDDALAVKEKPTSVLTAHHPHRFNITTPAKQSFYDKIFNSPDWQKVAKKKKTLEEKEAEIKKRKERNKGLAEKVASERAIKEEKKKKEILKHMNDNNKKQQQLEKSNLFNKKRVKVEDQLSDGGDIFDMSKKRKTITPKTKKKKKSANPF